MDCSLPGSSVHGISQARILEWVAIPFSRGSSWPRDWNRISCISGRFFIIWVTREAHNLNEYKSLPMRPGVLRFMGSQRVGHGWATDLIWWDTSCVLSHVSRVWLLATLWTVCSLPGSSVQGILQARILEWVAMPSSRGSSWPRDRTCVSYVSCVGRQVPHTSVKTILYFWYYVFGKKHNI